MLFRAVMNAHFFATKRAFQASLRLSRAVLAHYGLTPARFDLLHAICPCFVYRDRRTTMRQRRLRDILGVTAATLSRMLRSLETLGLIVRTRPTGDTRQRDIEITPEGQHRVESIREDVIDSGLVTLALDSAVGQGRWWHEWHCLFQKDVFESLLCNMRRAFRDVASLQYPWHPDD